MEPRNRLTCSVSGPQWGTAGWARKGGLVQEAQPGAAEAETLDVRRVPQH